MQYQAEVGMKDWKKEFAYYVKRNQQLKVISNSTDILTFLNSYFRDLKIELNEISENTARHSVSEYKGEFYALINGYKNVKIQYESEKKVDKNGVLIKLVTTDRMSEPTIVSKRKAWLFAEDDRPFITLSFNFNGDPNGNVTIFKVEMLDEIVKDYLMSVIRD